jgi:glycerol-3-phosphate acyltransferase PlsY
MWTVVLPVVGYLLGSVSSAIVVTKLMGLSDPRSVGSKNPGATNVLRYGGKTAAVLTLLGDVFKGMLAVALARVLVDDPWVWALTALAAFLGHLFPVFHGFKGGKGVATALGVWLAMNPWIGLLLAGTWVTVAAVFRYSSLAALAAALAAPFIVLWRMPVSTVVGVSVLMSAILIFRHRQNIRNLLSGSEGRIGR